MSGIHRFIGGAAMLLVAAIATGCAESQPAEIWIAGEKHAASGQRLAVLWRDGASVALPARAPGDDAFAIAIAIDGADVYAAGLSSELIGDARTDHPGYWKNATWNALPTLGGADAQVGGVVAQAGVPRVGGAVRDPATGLLVPGIWTDGPPGSFGIASGSGSFRFAPLPLPTDAQGGEVLSLRLVDGVLLAAGAFWRVPAPGAEAERVPTLWRNGIRGDFPLMAGATWALAMDVCVDQGVTYVVGHQYMGGLLTIPGYWRDGTWVELPRAAADLPGVARRCLARGGELVVVGSRVATVGPVWVGTGGYWRNGAWTTFSDPAHLDITMAMDVAELGADLLVPGAKVPGDTLTNSVGGYWRGAGWIALPMDPGEYGSVGNAIAVRAR